MSAKKSTDDQSIIIGKEAIRIATLEQIEKESSSTPTSKNKRRVMSNVYGRSFSSKLIPVEREVLSQKELRKAFSTFDRDESGFIDIYELKDILQSVGKNVTDEQIQEIMNEVDLDKNGVLDFEEFEYIVQVKLEDKVYDDQSLKELFDFFDRDKDGFISFDELYWVLTKQLKIKLTKEEVQDMLRYGDLDGNNLISLEEFQILLNS